MKVKGFTPFQFLTSITSKNAKTGNRTMSAWGSFISSYNGQCMMNEHKNIFVADISNGKAKFEKITQDYKI